MAKLTLLVAAPPVALAMLVLLSSFTGRCAAAEAQQPGAEEADLDTGVAGVEEPSVNASAASFGHSGVARATWYGAPNGAGPYDNGGACGFKNVNKYPFMAMTSCGNQPLFKDGKGCGACYKIKCTKHKACSGRTETVVITDMNYYPVAPYHFDLSGTAFGKLAKPGRNDELRHAGIIDISFTRVPCEFPGLKVGFHVEEGSNAVYMAILVEYENGDGDVVQVDLMEAKGPGKGRWTRMRESWGSICASTPTTGSRRHSPSASATSPARRSSPATSSPPTGGQTPSTAPSSSTARRFRSRGRPAGA